MGSTSTNLDIGMPLNSEIDSIGPALANWHLSTTIRGNEVAASFMVVLFIEKETRLMRIVFAFSLIISGMVNGTACPSLHGAIGMSKLEAISQHERNQGDQLALVLATKEGNEQRISSLLRAGANVNERDDFGNTPLIIAADGSNLAIVKVLLAAGADVTAANKSGFTALMNAADHGDFIVVKTLIKAGSDVNAKSKSGFSPLYMALRHVCENDRPCDSINELVTLLIEKGANVNARTTPEGESVLMAAAALGNVQAVKTLVGHGAIVNLVNSSGETAVCLAERGEFSDIAKFLKRVGGIGCAK